MLHTVILSVCVGSHSKSIGSIFIERDLLQEYLLQSSGASAAASE